MRIWGILLAVLLSGCTVQFSTGGMNQAEQYARQMNPQMVLVIHALVASGVAQTPDELARLTGYYQVLCNVYITGGGEADEPWGKMAAPALEHDAAVNLGKTITIDQAQQISTAFDGGCQRPTKTG
jgi:hypothetical protein